MIKYFDFLNNETETSPKNHLRAFMPNEAYLIKSDGVRIDNKDFNLSEAKAVKNYDVKQTRSKKYSTETDQLLLEIQAMEILGQDTTEKRNIFINAYSKIKSDLPLIE